MVPLGQRASMGRGHWGRCLLCLSNMFHSLSQALPPFCPQLYLSLSSHQHFLTSPGQWGPGGYLKHPIQESQSSSSLDPHLGKPALTPSSSEAPELLFICTEKVYFSIKKGSIFQ